MFLERPTSRGRKYPSPQSFAVYDNGFAAEVRRAACRQTPPKGEEIRRGDRDCKSLLRGKEAGPIYVSAKRTHLSFAHFSMYHFYLQRLMLFAGAFAIGFVFQNEPILGVFFLEGKRTNGE